MLPFALESHLEPIEGPVEKFKKLWRMTMIRLNELLDLILCTQKLTLIRRLDDVLVSYVSFKLPVHCDV